MRRKCQTVSSSNVQSTQGNLCVLSRPSCWVQMTNCKHWPWAMHGGVRGHVDRWDSMRLILGNPPGKVTHLPLSPPHQLCFSLCPGPTEAMKTPRSHFYSGRLSVSQTLSSAIKEMLSEYKNLTSVKGGEQSSLFFDQIMFLKTTLRVTEYQFWGC